MTQLDVETFKSKDAHSYDPVIEEFDRFSNRFSLVLAQRVVELAQLQPGQQVLDIGTGTGIVALQAAQKVKPGGKVLGADLSEAMLAAAVRKAERAGLADVLEFRQMDAEKLALPDQSFDAIVSLFALMHFPNPLAAIKEMFRVLKPGGKLVLAVVSGPPLLSLNGILHRLKRSPEVLQTRRSRHLNAPDFLDKLVEKHLPKPSVEPEESAIAAKGKNRSASVPRLVRQAGFTRLKTRWEGHQGLLATPEEFYELQRTYSSIARKRLADAPKEKVDGLRQEFFEMARRVQSRGGKLAYPYAAFFVIAQRPGK